MVLGVSVSLFSVEINTRIGGLRRADCPPPGGWASCSPLKGLREQRWSQEEAAPFFLPHGFSQDISFHLLLPLMGLYTIGVPGSQASGLRRSYSVSLHNHMTRFFIVSPHAYIYLLLFCFPREPWPICNTVHHLAHLPPGAFFFFPFQTAH